MIPSIDGDAEICRSFLPLLPTVLLNGTSGMAIGYSTNILPHAASDLKAAVVKKLRGETIENIQPNWKMYDCNVFDTDRELSYWVQGKVLIENTTTVRIVSLNPELSLEKLKEHLIWMQNEGHIVDFEDNTTSEIDITVKMKRADLAGKTEHDLVQMFKLSCRQTERLVVIGVDEKVKVYKDHDSLIGDWVEWRFTYYKRRFERLLGLASEKLSYLQDVIKVYEAGITSKLKDFQSKAEIDEFIEQVTGNKRPQISSFPTYRWTKESIDAIQAEIGELLLEITSHKYMIENENARRDLFITEVEQCC
jgi:DNA gyrase/topoisomerase IV subunit A